MACDRLPTAIPLTGNPTPVPGGGDVDYRPISPRYRLGCGHLWPMAPADVVRPRGNHCREPAVASSLSRSRPARSKCSSPTRAGRYPDVPDSRARTAQPHSTSRTAPAEAVTRPKVQSPSYKRAGTRTPHRLEAASDVQCPDSLRANRSTDCSAATPDGLRRLLADDTCGSVPLCGKPLLCVGRGIFDELLQARPVEVCLGDEVQEDEDLGM